jgi:hypothetical protein
VKIIFVDFDGVLNSHQYFLMNDIVTHKRHDDDEVEFWDCVRNLDPYNVWNLKFILENVPELQIVMSTNWRKGRDFELMSRILAHVGIPKERIHSNLPYKLSSHRCEEVGMFLYDHPDTEWILIDDKVVFDLSSPRKPFEHKTSEFTGLTYPDACDIIQRFEPNWKRPTILL